jgi:uncharacterized membrane protein YkgB
MAQTANDVMTSIFALVGRIAVPFVRIALGVVLLWIGALKFLHPAPNVALLQASFVLHFLASYAFVYVLGALEVLTGVLLIANIAVRYVGLLVVLLFVGTLTIFFTAPAVTYGTAGFPNLSVFGQFLLKDIVLAGASLTVVAADVARRASRGTSGGATRRGA